METIKHAINGKYKPQNVGQGSPQFIALQQSNRLIALLEFFNNKGIATADFAKVFDWATVEERTIRASELTPPKKGGPPPKPKAGASKTIGGEWYYAAVQAKLKALAGK